MQVQVEPRHRHVALVPGHAARPGQEVDLDGGDVERPPVVDANGITTARARRRSRPRPGRAATGGALADGGLGEQRGRERHHERDAPHPAITASRTVTRFETWEAPATPVNPPNGQRPRSQSIAVQSEAAPNAVTTGMPRAAHQRQERAEQRHRQGGQERQGQPGRRAEEEEPRQRDAEPGEAVGEPEDGTRDPVSRRSARRSGSPARRTRGATPRPAGTRGRR